MASGIDNVCHNIGQHGLVGCIEETEWCSSFVVGRVACCKYQPNPDQESTRAFSSSRQSFESYLVPPLTDRSTKQLLSSASKAGFQILLVQVVVQLFADMLISQIRKLNNFDTNQIYYGIDIINSSDIKGLWCFGLS
ncbi:hypothetical protein ACTFIU_003721 [Dictyostelium citrinum]